MAHSLAPLSGSWWGPVHFFAAASRLAFGCFESFEPEAPMTRNPRLILVAGPYRSGTGDDPAKIAANMHAMNEIALALFELGHIPVTGEALALPLIELAGSTEVGDAAFTTIFHPLAERLVRRCDGCLRIGGPSEGADEMVRLAQGSGRAVFRSLAEVPELRE
jgi:hypothetical protein